MRFADFEFDFERDQLRRAGVPIPLSPKPGALLRYFLANPQRLISKAELMSSLWSGVVVTDDSLVQCVGELRSRLGDQGPKLITTAPRRGYTFEAEVRPVTAARHDSRVTVAGQTRQADTAAAAAQPTAARSRRGRYFLAATLALVCSVIVGAAWYLTRAPATLGLDEEIARRNVTVLMPFKAVGDRPVPALVRDGLVDEIAAQFSERQGARILRSPSSPDARYHLNGRISAHGNGVAVDAQLTSVSDGTVVWSEHFESLDADDPRINFDIALRVVGSVRARMREMHRARVARPGHRFDTVDLVLSGWYDVDGRQTPEDVRRGKARFEQALRVDPQSVIALTGLGAALMAERFGNSGEPTPTDVAESERVAARALAISPNNSVSLINWGNVQLFRGQPDLALPMFERAVQRAPSNPNAHLRYAAALMLVGRASEMQPSIDQALRIGQRDSRILAAAHYVAAQAAFAMGDDERAYAMARRALVERQNYGLAFSMLASIDALHGRPDDAARHMAEHRRLMPHSTISRYLLNNPGSGSFLATRTRMSEGLRAAGLPEQ
ncbi:winged helix-turn-helix domain-containing protein [Variovorax sp. J22P168]|uniref:winged helix-turn-helix domain-containing tetratricopeptide repeat protein n=1 Tax=Variovorax jilinensis TaxID=3053513 RepID=UPI0025766084|nr:winged helix-turn-helix domain-containing protein [Variovorax sp. J22P168]MDM0014987.1 winged helix-turn-helix domain-containing protein [Variovorax sp. J22P168]